MLLWIVGAIVTDWWRKEKYAVDMNSLKQIGVALGAYNDVHKHLPTPRLVTTAGDVELSWRVSLLGYFGEMNLFNRFDQASAWDSPANLGLLDRMPIIYAPLQQRRDGETATYYQYFTGPETAFPNNDKVKLGRDLFADNLLCAQAARSVPWSKPADMAVAADQPLPLPQTEFLVCMGDGSVRHVDRTKVSDDALRWALKPDTGKLPPP